MNTLTLFHERYSTALLAPLNVRDKLAGPVVTVQANNDLTAILGAVHRAQPGDVVVIGNRAGEAALIGDLIGAEGHRRRLAGFVVDGLVRDTTTLLDIGIPVVCRGTVPIGPLKLPADLKGIGERGVTLALGGARVSPGDWAFADADGVIFLAAADLPAVYEQAERSWEREEALAAEIRAGAALGDLLGIDDFLAARESDPGADFNAHLAARGRAI